MDLVSGGVTVDVPLRMARSFVELDVLDERAAEGHVDELKATTDCQHW